MDMILDRTAEPSFEEIGRYVAGEAGERWSNFTGYIEGAYASKPQIAYSVCAGKPGWNVKYKKGGKALCTLYPESDSFIALIVLNSTDMDVFEAVKSGYTPYLINLFDNCKPFNNTKWLMIRISDNGVLEDAKNLLKLKLSKK